MKPKPKSKRGRVVSKRAFGKLVGKLFRRAMKQMSKDQINAMADRWSDS